jgi:hypothetical protein
MARKRKKGFGYEARESEQDFPHPLLKHPYEGEARRDMKKEKKVR